MAPRTEADKKEQLIEKIASLLEGKLPNEYAGQAAEFCRQFFQRVPPEDLLDDDPEDLYGAVLDFWNFIRQRRRPETAAVRAFNASLEDQGWQSLHTIVEVVVDDMPFLVDSVTMELNRHGLTVHRLIHPVIRMARNEADEVTEVLPPDADGGNPEATLHFEVDRQTDPSALDTLVADIRRVFNDVRVAVEDWQAMRGRMRALVAEIDTAHLPPEADDIPEIKAFLQWVVDDHFTFLGYRNYDLSEEDGEVVLRSVPNSGLGLLRDDGSAQVSPSFMELPPELRRLALAPTVLLLSKASARSTVHRPTHLDYLGIKRFDESGKVIGEHRFLGLFTSVAYNRSPREIPLLREKIARVMERAALPPKSHAGKALQNILDTFPRDDLFQASDDELHDMAMGILHLQERQQLKLFVRKDIFNRFVSCLVYAPRDRYNTGLRIRMQKILMRAFKGKSSTFNVQFTESMLARVQFHIRTEPGQIPEYSVSELNAQLRQAMLSWRDELERTLLDQCGEELGNQLFQRYGQAFPAAYREDFSARVAVPDIERMEAISTEQPLQMHLYRPLEDPEGLLRFKVFGSQPMPLSDVLPMLEKLGLKVLKARPYEIEPRGMEHLWILDFDMKEDIGIQVDVSDVKQLFQDAFAKVWYGQTENDGFNRLVLGARLPWRDVAMLRAYCKYLLQTRVPFSQAYMEQTFGNHPHIVRMLAELFHARFDPHRQREAAHRRRVLVEGIEEALDKVSSLDEDRILRRFLAVIQATLRTNFFQTDANGQSKEYVSFKFDPSKIPDLPKPRPAFEIFVYSPRMEAVHLRGGRVARGGLRWSDRREDFRTEILGLVKAQQVKNAVIVPVGSKGGFVVKRPPKEGGREALLQEGVDCYKTFMRGLLDITDNRVGDEIVPPPEVVRYDEDDPYLVVAADKGTATFSDIANGIAAEYNFWLGDAYASGGSAGYDHKKMGITARGAWESVKRHFRELGMDIQNHDDFTVVGIGDMAGDVFGNGMLLSRHIKLVCAFNHMHIFLDPNPDPEASFEERRRMFNLPRSTWEDYDKSLISQGGGIYPRTAKSITITPEVKQVLGIEADQLTPNELINAALKAPVDLLWNGGIGTYVKAVSETHAEVGDKANDPVRVNGRDLRCKVIGEGGNLGFTQLGRIEYTLKDGKALTDAIDNSGGVNCSDHEVNIKILLNQVVRAGDMTVKQRNQLLEEMTEEVAHLVLRQNYLQPEAISITYSQSTDLLGDHIRVMRSLERAGKLDRALEFLPSDEALEERQAEQNKGLVPPELAVLLAYSKIDLYEKLLASDVPDDPYFHNDLLNYFPVPLRQKYENEMEGHPLRREIISTYITNSTLNRMGSVFVIRLAEETGESSPNIARAYSAAREMFKARRLWDDIDALDNKIPAQVQIDMHIEARKLIGRASHWLLRHRRPPLDIETVIGQFGPGIAALRKALPSLLQPAEAEALQQASQRYIEEGAPEDLAQWVASLDPLYSSLDLIEVASQAKLPAEDAATIYFALISRLELGWLRKSIAALAVDTYWQRRARASLMNSLYDQQRALAADVLRLTEDEQAPEQRLQAWLERNRDEVERLSGMFADLRASGQPDLAMLSVAIRETANLTSGT